MVVFFIIYAGFLFVTAQGKDEALKSARKALVNALIGAAIVFGAFVILEVIEATVNAFLVA